MNQDVELLLYFLNKIHSYYPIGLPHLRDDYEGYQNLLDIQNRKMNKAIEGKHEHWEILVNKMKQEWGNEQVLNLAGAPFPCYQTTINLGSVNEDGCRKSSQVILTVSLLVSYYALFVCDDYDFITYSGSKPITNHKIISSGEGHPMIANNMLEKIKEAVETAFQGYKHANHHVLFKHKILGGFGLNGWLENMNNSVIYDYLFGSDMIDMKYSVAP